MSLCQPMTATCVPDIVTLGTNFLKHGSVHLSVRLFAATPASCRLQQVFTEFFYASHLPELMSHTGICFCTCQLLYDIRIQRLYRRRSAKCACRLERLAATESLCRTTSARFHSFTVCLCLKLQNSGGISSLRSRRLLQGNVRMQLPCQTRNGHAAETCSLARMCGFQLNCHK